MLYGKGKSVLGAGRRRSALRRHVPLRQRKVCDAGAPPAEKRVERSTTKSVLGMTTRTRVAKEQELVKRTKETADEGATTLAAEKQIMSTAELHVDDALRSAEAGVDANMSASGSSSNGTVIGEDEIAALERMMEEPAVPDAEAYELRADAERARFFDDGEHDIERDIEELSRMVSRARMVSKAAAQVGSLSFLDGTDIESLDEKAFEKIASTGRMRRKNPLPHMKPTLPPAPSREGMARIVSSSWLRDKQMTSMAPMVKHGDATASSRSASAGGGRSVFGSAAAAAAASLTAAGSANFSSSSSSSSSSSLSSSFSNTAVDNVGMTRSGKSTCSPTTTPTSSNNSRPASGAGREKGSGGGHQAANQGSNDTFEKIENVVKDIKAWRVLNKVFTGMTDELGREPSKAEWAFRAGLSVGELDRRLRWYRKCDQHFVELMNPIVAHVYRKYGFRGNRYTKGRGAEQVDQADMFMAGMMGAWECVDKWTPGTEKNSSNRFAFLVTYYIRAAMSKCLTDRLRDDTPTSIFMMIGKLKRTAKMLSGRLGRQPTDDELGSVLGISAKRVAKVKAAVTRKVSADRPSEMGEADGDMRSSADTLGDPTTAHLLEDCVDEMMDDDIEALLKTLAPREYMVLSRRYPRTEEDAGTLEEIGASLNVCRERVRQIEDKALQKLKHQSRNKALLFQQDRRSSYSGI